MNDGLESKQHLLGKYHVSAQGDRSPIQVKGVATNGKQKQECTDKSVRHWVVKPIWVLKKISHGVATSSFWFCKAAIPCSLTPQPQENEFISFLLCLMCLLLEYLTIEDLMQGAGTC